MRRTLIGSSVFAFLTTVALPYSQGAPDRCVARCLPLSHALQAFLLMLFSTTVVSRIGSTSARLSVYRLALQFPGKTRPLCTKTPSYNCALANN